MNHLRGCRIARRSHEFNPKNTQYCKLSTARVFEFFQRWILSKKKEMHIYRTGAYISRRHAGYVSATNFISFPIVATNIEWHTILVGDTVDLLRNFSFLLWYLETLFAIQILPEGSGVLRATSKSTHPYAHTAAYYGERA